MYKQSYNVIISFIALSEMCVLFTSYVMHGWHACFQVAQHHHSEMGRLLGWHKSLEWRDFYSTLPPPSFLSHHTFWGELLVSDVFNYLVAMHVHWWLLNWVKTLFWAPVHPLSSLPFSAFVVNCQCFCFVVSSDTVQVQENWLHFIVMLLNL